MRILMLSSFNNIKSPLPRIVPWLSEALRTAECKVIDECWGRRHDNESPNEKVKNRISDIIRIRKVLTSEGPFDIMYIHNKHDWKTISRDLPLLIGTRGLYRQAVLHIHGSNLDWIQNKGFRAFKAANRLLFNFLGGVILSSKIERRAFSKFLSTHKFFVADNVYQPRSMTLPVIPAKWNLPTDRPIIFFAGRLIPEKGILDLLDAIPLVLEKISCHFLIAGIGILEGEVKTRLALGPIAGHASWVGYLDWAHLELAYDLATIFVLPTYFEEGFPAVIQDALGHGLPIVTTANRGIVDHIMDGIHALLTPPNDPEALAKFLVALLQDENLRNKMSSANLKKVQDFSPTTLGRRYTQILNHILDE